jgi:nucleoside-diphosphate-sugar epimerase
MMGNGTSEIIVVGADGTLGEMLKNHLTADGISLRCENMAKCEPPHLENYATVINAAGPRARPGLNWSDYFREHIGTARAIVHGMHSGSHLIHLSSTAVYGAQAALLGPDSLEAPLLFPMPGYAAAKLASEYAIRASCEARGIGLTILRLSMVYGAGVDSALDSLSRMANRGLRLMLKPDTFRQHLLNIELLVHGMKLACQRGPAGSNPLILADPFFITNGQINDALVKKYPKSKSISMPLSFFANISRRWKRISEFSLTMPIASLAVLAIDNEFAWQPAFHALGINPDEFNRNNTFDKYFL